MFNGQPSINDELELFHARDLENIKDIRVSDSNSGSILFLFCSKIWVSVVAHWTVSFVAAGDDANACSNGKHEYSSDKRFRYANICRFSYSQKYALIGFLENLFDLCSAAFNVPVCMRAHGVWQNLLFIHVV